MVVRGEAFHTQIARKPRTSDFWVAIIEFPHKWARGLRD
jgi:hypothetical protein